MIRFERLLETAAAYRWLAENLFSGRRAAWRIKRAEELEALTR